MVVIIDVIDIVLNVVNDVDSVGYGNMINGNLISGEGGNGVDNIGQDVIIVYLVEFNGVNYLIFDVNNQIMIDVEYGILMVNRDGMYFYELIFLFEVIIVGGGNLGIWSGVNFYGF